MIKRLLMMVALAALPSFAGPPQVLHVNEANPGQKLDLKPFVVKGHYTVFEFRSVY
ncbi:MAG TPA: hypothetical protein VGO93_15095 [Candidatus Xenobia bacterium]|jgi:hypothetical protein